MFITKTPKETLKSKNLRSKKIYIYGLNRKTFESNLWTPKSFASKPLAKNDWLRKAV